MKSNLLLGTLLVLIGAMSSCNEREVIPLDQALSSSTRQNVTVDAKTKIDLLFIVDASQSMEEEQDNLAENFDTFSDFIFEDLKNAVDYRIAVVSTGEKEESDTNGVTPKNLGVFVNPSLNSSTSECATANNQVISPNNLGCDLTDTACQRANLKTQFSCAAKVGTDGILFERGLEAMRSSLSCNGPNANFLGACCEYDERTGIFNYDPLCRAQSKSSLPPPEFLRPEALLVVVFITDEDDCSIYADAPIDSPYATCSVDHNELKTALGSGDIAGRQSASALIYNAYSNPRYCQAGNPQACHAAECNDGSGTTVEPIDCYFNRCALSLSTDGSGRLDLPSQNACRRQANKLAPISYYHRFLMGLKERPNEQIIIANIVTPGLLTDSGARLSFSDAPLASSNCGTPDYVKANLSECCPNGQCGEAPDPPSCPGSVESGYSAWRYIDLITMFGENGLGCREGETQNCVNLCDPRLTDALSALRNKVISSVGEYCVARRPACLVNDLATGTVRECVDVEFDVASNYQLSLRQVCELSPEENGDCGVVGYEEQLVLDTDYSLVLNDLTCASGMRIKLNSPPSPGSRTKIDFIQNEQIFND